MTLVFSAYALANPSDGILREKDCFGDTYEGFINSQINSNDYGKAKRNRLESILRSKVNKKEFQDLRANFTCKIIVYKSGLYPVGGILLTPNIEQEKKLPAVIFNRGGNGRFGALTYSDIFLHLKPIAEIGAVVLATQYRGGMELRDGPGEEVDEFGGRDVKDVTNIVHIASQLPYVDKNQIHMVGMSRGGMSAFLSLKELDNIKSLTVIGSPSDLFKSLEERPEMEEVLAYRVPNFTSNRDSEITKRSVIYWVKDLPRSVPILILHGSKDKRVSVEQAKALANKLSTINHPHKLVIYDDYHGLPFSSGKMFNEIEAWIAESKPND
ncbi:alpha/beta hydrolase family protein [Idiomarina sp. HP20-50]|uniref:alpha/beta hydrolase family protein n=1 Tax=Idiomarina sp. HP20-50 TaxID=3070813 RepID=UPI00294B18CC|nr:prolyl oligopeptidase family serine peptidase [Idiomarina sp. HP20-50]MDV6314913.1 prolyl oligopeptidase family serine peptidase [Idiomarina sp. HP20-50]